MIYEEILNDLEAAGIRYLVVGGVAVVFHGFVRATADLDLMVAMDRDNLDNFLSLMKRRGYKPKVPVQIEEFADAQKRQSWIEEKGMKVFSLIHPQKYQDLIDIFVGEPISFEEAYKRRKIVQKGSIKFGIIAARDLIELKKKAGRPQDVEDIKAIEAFYNKQYE